MRQFPVSCLFLALGLLLMLGACGTHEDSPVSDALREQAVEVLDEVMREQESWVKVHAAEYKIWAGYGEGVRETYLAEKVRLEELPQYRVGIWRVLAQASPEERDFYGQKVVEAFRDPLGEDRIHAAETAAKLGISLSDLAPEETKEVLAGPINSLYVYTLWSTLQGSLQSPSEPSLLDLVLDNVVEDLPRMQAAFALRNERNISPDQWESLASTAMETRDGDLSRVYLLSAAYVNAPDSYRESPLFSQIKKSLLELELSPRKGERMELLMALSIAGNEEDLPLMKRLFDGENPILIPGETKEASVNSPDNADVRATAAYAILQLDRKQPYSLAWGDWMVIVMYLSGMLGIGYFFSRRNKNAQDYYLGGGKMNPIAVGLSLFATLLSSLSYLSYPGEMIKYGPVIFSGVLVFPLVYYVVGWFLIPKFMKLRVTSAYEILEINLGVSIRLLATFFFLSLRFLWMGTIIFITVNTAILSIFGFDPAYTLLISVLLMGITVVYTTMGGLKAVVFTDVIQSGVLIGGALLTLAVVSWHFGSFSAWIPTEWIPYWGEFKWGFDARERLTIGNALLTTFVWYLASSGSDQMSIQRFLATENIHTARRTFGVSLMTTFVVQILLGLVGLAVMAYFTAFPRYLAPGETLTSHADQLFPKFILVGLPVGISGLVAAGILAAAMSSLSSGLNSTSSVISEDLLKRFSKRYTAPKNQLKSIQKLSLFVGVLALGLSLGISRVEGNLYDVIVKVVNLFVSPLFVLFFLALFVPFATAKGTFWGGISSVAIAIAVAFYKVFGIEVLYIMPVSLFVGILVGTLLSWVDHRILGNPETMKKRVRAAAIIKEKVI
ncbi:sodium:solute symporter [Lunatimonas salinarum]|uniref:sodium:solute symporter n=1 Tax=Lunatimonas salinarum TaxID=1774590 RepID=UPI001ADF9581|nr:sodium:solute symporter [Lunatimonas salinarum]